MARSFSGEAVSAALPRSVVAAMPTLIVWGIDDHAMPPGNLTGWPVSFTNLGLRLFPEGNHIVSQMKYPGSQRGDREFLQGKDVPRVRSHSR